MRALKAPIYPGRVFAALLVLLGTIAASIGCAPKRDFTPANVSAWDIVENMALESPPALSASRQQDFQRSWQDLQRGNLEAASSELESLSRRDGQSAEIATARGFLELRLGSADAAERFFQTALRERPGYGPAQSGFFVAALTAGADELAYERLGRLESDFPQHPLVDRYRTTLQINVAESRVATARELRREGRFDEASAAYSKALEVAPGVGALYLEAAEAELSAGAADRAVRHAQRASELESNNAEAFRVLGEARYASGELTGAYQAYRRAAELSADDAKIQARLEVIEREYEEENLPPEYLGIRDEDRVTRAQLAALFYLELRDSFEGVSDGTSVIATDIGASWASTFIRRVLGVGILEVYANHTFQPEGFVRRIELCEALARALERLAPEAYRTAVESTGFDQTFSDLTPTNSRYAQAALAVSLGLVSVNDNGELEPQAFASGLDAVSAVDELSAHLSP